jgi:hypothetical protein
MTSTLEDALRLLAADLRAADSEILRRLFQRQPTGGCIKEPFARGWAKVLATKTLAQALRCAGGLNVRRLQLWPRPCARKEIMSPAGDS